MVKGAGTVVVNIIGRADELKKSLDQADKDLGGFSGKLESFGKTTMATGAKFTAGLTLPIVGGLALATKAAAEDEAAQARLAKTLKNTVGASDDVVASVEKQIGAMMKVSTFSDDDLRPAYENLVRETRDVAEAHKLMQTAMDLAAAKGISVEEASMLLVKAHNGQTKALAALGIETKNTEGKAASYADIMRDVNQVVGGQAVAATETAAGKTKVLQRDMGELVETLGVALVPIMEKVVGWVQTITDKFSTLSPGVQTALLVVAGLAAAIGPLISVIGALSVAMAFLAANPVVAIIVGLGLLVAALVYAWQNSETFRDTVKNAFQAVVNGVKDGIGWILDGIDKLLGGFATMAEAASKIPGIGDKFKGVAETIRGLQHDVQGWADNMHTGLDLVKRGADSANVALRQIRMPAGFIGPLAPGQVPSTFIGPLLGERAAGGPVWPGGAFMVGERGPELFTPGQAGTIHPTGTVGGTSVMNSYSIVVTAIDPAAAQEAVITAIKEYERRNGTDWRVA